MRSENVSSILQDDGSPIKWIAPYIRDPIWRSQDLQPKIRRSVSFCKKFGKNSAVIFTPTPLCSSFRNFCTALRRHGLRTLLTALPAQLLSGLVLPVSGGPSSTSPV